MIVKSEIDVVDLYKKGYSIDYIVDRYYEYKNKDCVKDHYFNGTYIITKKKAVKSCCRNCVEEILLSYTQSILKNKA